MNSVYSLNRGHNDRVSTPQSPTPQSPAPQSPAPQYNVAPTPTPQPSNGLAITALIIGIIAFLSGFAPVWGIIIGVAAIVFGALAIKRRQNKTFGILGIIGGSIATITSIITTIVLIAGIGGANQALQEAAESLETAPAATAPADGSAPVDSAAPEVAGTTVEYQAETDGATMTVSWFTIENGGSSQQQDTAAVSPWSQSVTVDDPGAFDYQAFSLSVMADADATSVTCRIVVDGEVKSENTSSGPYSMATCSINSLD